MLKAIALLPRSAWRTIELDVPTRKFRFPRVYEQKVSLAGSSFRQLFIQDLGHDEPTILLTNQRLVSAKKLITRYAQRMLILMRRSQLPYLCLIPGILAGTPEVRLPALESGDVFASARWLASSLESIGVK